MKRKNDLSAPAIRDPLAVRKTVARLCALAAGINVLLFFVKLYVGLSSNSIAIFSDAVNNLTDSLSGVLAAAMIYADAASRRTGGPRNAAKSGRTEQLLSFILAVAVAAAGAVFAYNSAERMMYPTPVWFLTSHFYVIALTVPVKLGMFFFFRKKEKETGSSVIRMLKTDSLLDFGVTGAALLSFTLTRYLEFAVDAAAGMAVGAVIIVQAVAMIRKSVRELTGSAGRAVCEKVEAFLETHGDVFDGRYFFSTGEGGEVSLFLFAKSEKAAQAAVAASLLEEEINTPVLTTSDGR